MKMKILLATDGSEGAQAAIDFMERFPFPEGGQASVLTVINRDDFMGKEEKQLTKEQRKVLREAREMVRKESKKLLASEASRLKSAGWKVTTEVRDGHPASEIVDAAKENKADLVIVGGNGMGGIERLFLGSVSDAVLKHAPCSVLIVKASGDEKEKSAAEGNEGKGHPLQVLVAYDGTKAAQKAASFCASLPFSETDQVTLLSVLPLVRLYHQDIQERLSGFWRKKKKNAEKALEQAKTEAKWSPPFVSTRLLESSDVTQAIVDAGSELDADLLVLGYKGKGAMEKLLSGSITSGIVHHVPCSILAVR